MLIISVFIIVILISLSALFAATETAITATSPGKIQKLKSDGNKRALLVLNILKTKEDVISTMLIGNNLMNTICTTLATGLFIDMFGEGQGTVIASIVMALTLIIFAEVTPKAIAVVKAEPIMLFIAPTIMVFLKLLRPINTSLLGLVRVFCKISGINLEQKISGAEEVRGMIEHQHQEGNVYKADRDMLGAVLDLGDMTISEIMVHRSDIVSVNADLPIGEIVQFVLSSPYSRLPLWQNDKDNIIGVLHIRDLLKELHKKANDISKIDIKALLVEPWFIPENALVSQQLHAFRSRKMHFACVVDEYGALQGVLSLEDILEEIVGQIQDEYDIAADAIVKKSDNEFLIQGSATIRDINRELGWELPDEHANTLAGLIIYQIERIPNQGERFDIFNLNIVVTKKTGNKIASVRVTTM